MDTLNLHNIKEMILQLHAQKEQYEVETDKIRKAIKALQDVCQHDMQHLTTTPHYRLYECTKCGHQTTE